MKIETRIRQSAVRVRSGTRLVLVLLAGAVSATIFDVRPIQLVCGGLAVFAALNTALEYWNVRRLTRRLGGTTTPKRP